jgi:hypothetical protein
MRAGLQREVGKAINGYASHVPIPYGCMSLLGLILGLATVAVFSTLAIGMTIFK